MDVGLSVQTQISQRQHNCWHGCRLQSTQHVLLISQLDFVVHGSPNAASCMRIAAMVNLHVNFETVFTVSRYAFLLSFYPRLRQFRVISVVMFVASCHWLRSYIASTKSLDLASPNPIISSQTLKHTPV